MENSTTAAPVPPRKKMGFWRKLGGGSLTLSLIIHGVILLLGAVWIIRVIPPPPEKVVDFMPASGGGGSPSSQNISQQKQKASVMKPNLSRISVAGVAGSVALPDMDDSAQLSSLGALSSGGLSGGLGGSGSGGGRGEGMGSGFGMGTGPGAGLGGGTANPFGMLDPNANGLEGVFYDLKQTKSRKETEIGEDGVRKVIAEFVQRGWRESALNDYYQAPNKLYLTKLYIPTMSANEAPAAFKCEKEVQPSKWVIIYRGTISPPKTGKYRFVGAADDVMVIRFNKKEVFDHGYTSGTTGLRINSVLPILKGEDGDKTAEKELKRHFPSDIPSTFYQYSSTPRLNTALGGLVAGAEFEAVEGQSYPIEILLSEVPGGLFSAALLIEEVGGTYKSGSDGVSILPIFRTDNTMPKLEGVDVPPIDPTSPVWKVKKQTSSIDF